MSSTLSECWFQWFPKATQTMPKRTLLLYLIEQLQLRQQLDVGIFIFITRHFRLCTQNICSIVFAVFFLSLFHCFVTCRTSSARLCVYGICDWNYWTSSSSTYHKSTWIKWHKITTTKKNLDRKNLFAFIIWTVVQWWLHYKFARSVVGTDVRLLYLANTKLTWIHGFTLYIFPFSNLYRPFIFQIQVS